MSFQTLQARINASVLSRLGDGAALLDGVAVHGVFDAAYSVGNVGQLGMSSTEPVYVLAASDVPQSPVGCTLTFGGASYAVTACKPDGHGMVVLMLERAA